jgi:hypothetical protein
MIPRQVGTDDARRDVSWVRTLEGSCGREGFKEGERGIVAGKTLKKSFELRGRGIRVGRDYD